MPDVLEYHHTVGEEELDGLGHANNVAYVEWMQAAALAHSAAQGWPADRYQRVGRGWVVRRHTINYHKPAVAGDRIVVRTWVATMRRVTSLRRYRIVRPSDGAVLATAETLWAFIDYASGQPVRILPEIAQAFRAIEKAGREQ
ncbi:MAG TPA: acyl-CoA thioesterase [Planctomycetaceae bacterium]|nr:acyl-CoA thioesterase [Planctomycetaceae bacterium]HIQ21810.1 acyl-CoA thioesterase [Planctomycetota bacterium]